MKKMLCFILLSCLVLSLIVGGVALWRNRQQDAENKGTIYVNDVKLRSKKSALLQREYTEHLIIPLETIFEVLNFESAVDESTGNIYFDDKGTEYVCRFITPNPNFPENKFMRVSKVEDMNSRNESDFIQLTHSVGSFGWYRMIDDDIYLHQESAQFFLEAFECEVDIDLEERAFRIDTKH